MRQLLAFSLLVLLSFAVLQTVAQDSSSTAPVAVPRLIRFSGTAHGSSGKPLTGVVGITFSLYKGQDGGAALWLETQNVTLDTNGVYSVLLGATKAHASVLSSIGFPKKYLSRGFGDGIQNKTICCRAVNWSAARDVQCVSSCYEAYRFDNGPADCGSNAPYPGSKFRQGNDQYERYDRYEQNVDALHHCPADPGQVSTWHASRAALLKILSRDTVLHG
jgi:hypothetical protein